MDNETIVYTTSARSLDAETVAWDWTYRIAQPGRDVPRITAFDRLYGMFRLDGDPATYVIDGDRYGNWTIRRRDPKPARKRKRVG